MKYLFIAIFILVCSYNGYAQITEFKKEWITHLRWHNGLVTNFHQQPDLYVGGLQLTAQYGILPGKIRAGAAAGFFHTAKKLQAVAGITSSFLIKQFKAGNFGTAGNIHATLEHLWGTKKQQLFGGGIHADALNKITIGFTAHRDYKLNNWWWQSVIGFKLSKTKKAAQPFNQ
jgi:hypothetical protein